MYDKKFQFFISMLSWSCQEEIREMSDCDVVSNWSFKSLTVHRMLTSLGCLSRYQYVPLRNGYIPVYPEPQIEPHQFRTW